MEYLGNIFFDFDEFMFRTGDHLVSYVNNRWNISTKQEDYGNNPPLDKIIKWHRPDIQVTFNEAYLDVGQNFHASHELHEAVLPHDDMPEIVGQLAKYYRLYVVTSRQKFGRSVVERVLDRHVPGCIADIHMVWDFVDGEYVAHPKKDFVKNVPGENIAFFDDTPDEIINMQGIIPSYLFDPTGKHETLTDIKLRVDSWKKIGELYIPK